MRPLVSLVALSCVGASLLPIAQQISIALVVAAILLAAGAIGSYLVGEMISSTGPRRRGRKKAINMRRYTRPIPVDHADARRGPGREDGGAHSI